jgi:ferredoxin
MSDEATVRVDRELCMSSGRCVSDVPEAFAFDDEELATVLPGAAVVELRRLLAAAQGCPSQAISVEAAGTAGV